MSDFNKYTSKIDYSAIIEFALQNGELMHYKKREYFNRQGEVCYKMGYVVSGSFRYCCINSSGESKVVGYTFENSFVVLKTIQMLRYRHYVIAPYTLFQTSRSLNSTNRTLKING